MSRILDDPGTIEQGDPAGMLGILGRFDEQLEEALAIGEGVALPKGSGTLHHVLFCGLGGSAIGGDFIRTYLGTSLALPLLVNRNYSIPGFANRKTLVFVCSYSGNTEETLAAFDQARRSGCPVICLTSNGELSRLAHQHGCPCAKLPPGLPPRTTLGFSSVPALVVLSRLGLIDDCTPEIRRSRESVRRWVKRFDSGSPEAENRAKQLALRIQGLIPIIYGSQDRLDMVAMRWRSQFSENGKQLAYAGALPEMNHNEIVGWRHPQEGLSRLLPLFLRDRDDHPRVQLRVEITRELLSHKPALTLEYWSEGESWLERLWYLILLGDYASVYLAFLNREDPTPVDVIESLKDRLKEYG